jgi:hypothetical protein
VNARDRVFAHACARFRVEVNELGAFCQRCGVKLAAWQNERFGM